MVKYRIEIEERSIKIINEWDDFIHFDFPNDESWKKVKEFIDDTESLR